MEINMKSLADAVDALVDAVVPFLQDGESGQRTTTVAVMKYLRPYVEAAVLARAPGKVRGVGDRRLQPWRVHVEVYESDVAAYITPGRVVSPHNRDDVIEFGGDVYLGLDGFADWLTEGMLVMGAPESIFGIAHTRTMMLGLRQALGKGGAVKFSRSSPDGRWKVMGQIKREIGTQS